MGRFISLVIFLVALQAILILFEGQTPANTTLWQIATQPQNWNSLTFIASIAAISLGIAAAGAFVGTIVGLKTDFMVFSAMIPGLISLCVPIINLAMVIGKYASNIFCSTAIFDAGGLPLSADTIVWSSCPAAVWIVVITGGILGVYYIFTVIDWWRSRD